MQVDFDDGFFYCHGCTASGKALKFVELMNPKLNELQALKKYFKILKSKKCIHIKLNNRKREPRNTDIEQLNIAHDYYYGLRTIDWETESEPEVLEALQYMLNRGFTSKVLNNCKAKVSYNKSYGIIFPMLDNGEFKGWVCRTMLKSIEKKRKYLYNEGFSRATTLVGDYKNVKTVIVCEGYMDRLKLRSFGEKHAVALLGWKATDEQIQKLKNQGVTTIISALDNDKYGRAGTEYLKQYFKVIRFCYLKGIKDPGDMTKELYIKMKNKTKLSIVHKDRASK
jgi:DNA primase